MNGHLPMIGRRSLLLGLAAGAVLGSARLAFATGPGGEDRFVVVLLRGAMDGLAAVQPYGDPALAGLRGPLALPEPGQEGGVLDLGGFFGLHPRLAKLHARYEAGELLALHAVCGPTRSRSHFEAQDMLESGAEQRLSSGWLNRALAGVESDGRPVRPGIGIGGDLPLLLRGTTPVGMYAPSRPDRPDPDLYARLYELNHADPVIGPAVTEGMRARGFTERVVPREEQRNGFVRLAEQAGRILAAPGGPRVAAMDIGGWDTHQAQRGRLAPVLTALDDGLDALRISLGDAWSKTAVLVMTEFGRTARVNGNEGTDHGTGGAAFVVGGAVQGGRALADWPGLGEGRLHENRDLAPTRDLRSVAKGLLQDHLRLTPSAIARAFPESGAMEPVSGLIRT
ncbi:DUF1501 domain-containing protein [Roseomonas sp. CCTCC AB2023176]|uniref:DUF1501 domain-containing protein n=1 Tax=Roseomonas sp. CCTCC AB2023176 TaxID=3342640 RepID=UPI0035E1C884